MTCSLREPLGWFVLLLLLASTSANDVFEYENGVTLDPYSLLYKGVVEEPTQQQVQGMMKEVTNTFVRNLLHDKVSSGLVSATTDVVPLALNNDGNDTQKVYGSFQGDSLWYRIHYNTTVYFTFESAMLPSIQLTQMLEQQWNANKFASEGYIHALVAHMQQHDPQKISPFRSVSHVSLLIDSSEEEEEENNNRLEESTPVRGLLLAVVAIVMVIPFALFMVMLYKVFIVGPPTMEYPDALSLATTQQLQQPQRREFDKVRQIETIPEEQDLESEREERFEDDFSLKKDAEKEEDDDDDDEL